MKIVAKSLRILLVTYANLVLAQLPNEFSDDFWDQQRKGANGDGGIYLASGDYDEWFKAASAKGIEFVRLSTSHWRGEGRDFLLGDADEFTSIPKSDLLLLKNVLSSAHKHNVKVVLTMFSLPGARNRQDNNYQHDYRLWNEEKYQTQAIEFWRQLAEEFKSNPAVVAYNPLNEPHPAREYDINDQSPEKTFNAWIAEHRNGLHDLNRFNNLTVDAIRSVDKSTYIVLNFSTLRAG